MRSARFDQYQFPDFRSIAASFGLWCVAISMPVLALIALSTEHIAYIPGLILLCFGASYLLYKKNKENVALYQSRRDTAADVLFNSVSLPTTIKILLFFCGHSIQRTR
jgi:hypothetical protein